MGRKTGPKNPMPNPVQVPVIIPGWLRDELEAEVKAIVEQTGTKYKVSRHIRNILIARSDKIRVERRQNSLNVSRELHRLDPSIEV